jgi:hypothetical protein
MIGLGIIIGIFLGAISWHIGLLKMADMQKRQGCYRNCVNCGRPYDYPLTFATEHGRKVNK